MVIKRNRLRHVGKMTSGKNMKVMAINRPIVWFGPVCLDEIKIVRRLHYYTFKLDSMKSDERGHFLTFVLNIDGS